MFYRGKLKELLPDRKDWKASIKPIFRGSILGFLLGIIPGGGATIASFSSYAIEKGLSSTPENFGQGAIEGVAGPESANNSAVSGAFIPLLTLGIPANSVMALMIGAFMIHGVTPGPLIMKDHPELFWGVITSMYIGNILLLIMNVPLIRLFVKIVEIPYAILSPLIILICTIGAYSINNSHADVIMMILFGILGYLMRKFDYDLAPLILAFVLGPLLEKSMRQSLISSNGDLMIFFTRPIAATIMMITVVVIISSCLFATVLKQKQAARVLDKLRSATSDDEP